MKHYYEERSKTYLPRRSYVIVRVDGVAFHTYTKGLKRPFDEELVRDMNETAKYLAENIQGCKLAYVQSDEISLLLTDFDTLQSEAWFDNEVQKIVSVAASLATARFNELRQGRFTVKVLNLLKETPEKMQEELATFPKRFKLATFNARAFVVPNKSEAINYLIWRQQDATRNSLQMQAQSLFSHNELQNKNSSDLQEMIFSKGMNWNELIPRLKRGGLFLKTVVHRGTREVGEEEWNEYVARNGQDAVSLYGRFKIPMLEKQLSDFSGNCPIFVNAEDSLLNTFVPDNL